MKRVTRLALGGFGVAVVCALVAVPAPADESPRASSAQAGASFHPAPSHRSSGVSPAHFQTVAPRAPSGSAFLQRLFGPPAIHSASQNQPSRQPDRGSTAGASQSTVHASATDSSRGYASGAWTGTHQANAGGNDFYSLRGRNVAALGSRDRDRWTRGQWRQTWHNSHYGWWWRTGGGWYFYDAAVHPYPDYISDYVYDDYDAATVSGTGRHYCDNPRGYYPQVSRCMDPWQSMATE